MKPTTDISPSFSIFLDASRWIAAFFVLISHVRHIILADYGNVTSPTLLAKVVYIATSLGHEAVVVFFVISGFLVGGLTLRKWQATGIAMPGYFLLRFSRIYTVLIPALLVGCLLDWTGYHVLNGSSIYTDPDSYHTNSIKLNIAQHISLMAFIDNLFMLEGGGRGAPVLGSNAPLWTLAYEWWYYCIFAAAAGMWLFKDRFKAATCCVWFVVFLLILPNGLLVWMLIWALGIIALYYAESQLPKPPVFISASFFTGAVALSRMNTHQLSTLDADQPMYVSFLFEFCIGITYSALMVSMYRNKEKEDGWLRYSKVHSILASFSYTLYLTHFPLMVFLAALGHDVFNLDLLAQPTTAHLCYYVLMITVLAGYAFAFSRCTERYTPTVRKLLANRFDSTPSRGGPPT